MKYTHGIVAVNRPDLLAMAVESIRPLWHCSFVLDNSAGGELGTSRQWPIPVIRPSVPLSCAQSMNLLHRLAKKSGADVFGYQHNDAEACEDSAQKYYAFVESTFHSDRKWATVFTSYDIMSAYHVRAVDEIGEWDSAFPNPNYHIDVDWFHRARLKGFELINSCIKVTHHGGSSTVKSDPLRLRISKAKAGMNVAYYRQKWGGPPHEEVFSSAWDEQ